MDKKNIPQKPVEMHPVPPPPSFAEKRLENPNVLVYNFLKANNIRMKITAIDPIDNGFIQTGFIIEDRPILQVVFERI